jgi:Spy/CpxP family protein refolding chaperone
VIYLKPEIAVMRNPKLFGISILIALLLQIQPVYPTPIICAPSIFNDTRQAYHCAGTEPQEMRVNTQLLEGGERQPAITMSITQRNQLFTLMQQQAKYRREIKRTAYKALQKLQQLAVKESFNKPQARQLADNYGKALAELALLDIQLTSRLRNILTPAQRKALQNKIDKSRFLGDPKL